MSTHQQRAMKRSRFTLSTTALAALAVVGSAHAQTAPAPERVEVSGLRASLESALNNKREDRGIVDVIRSEDIGKFPDTNLAESLQRVPGVVIDRDAGEGRSITVRGLGSDFTRVRINGIEALATTGGTDSSGGNNRSRGFDFNVFASELFSSITVRKSASADVDEGSLGATVDLQTMRPFDLRGFTAMASVKGRYNDLSQKTDPRTAFLISNTTEDRKFGALLSVAQSRRNSFEEGFSTVRWDNGPSSGGWKAAGSDPAALAEANKAENFHPRLPRYGRLTHDQDRLGVTASLQARPTPDTLATFDLMYAKLNATRQEDFLSAISFSRAASAGGKPQTSVLETQYSPSGALLYGRYDGVDLRAESRFDQLSTVFKQPTLTLEHNITDSLKVTARAGRAQSVFSNPIQTTTTLDAPNANGFSIDFRNNDRLPAINWGINPAMIGSGLTIFPVPAGATSLANATPSEIRIRPQGSENTNDLRHLSFAWDAIPDRLTLNAGVDLKRYTFSTYESRRGSETIYAPPAGVALNSLMTTLTGFGRGLSLPAGSATSWVIPNLAAITQAYNIYCNCLQSGPLNGPGDYTLSSITNGNARGNNRNITETDTGGFLMADFNTRLWGQKLRGNAGVRYVKTEMVSTGYLATGGGTPVTVENSYTDTLPSVNLAMDLNKETVLRLGAAKVMSRPQLGNLSPGGSISTSGTLTVNTGNPLLKPFRADTLDGSLEWYHGRNAFVGLGLFYKNIDTYIQSLRQNVAFKDTGLPKSLLPTNFTGDEVFQVTTPINTQGGKLKGFEVNVQQPFTTLPGFLTHTGVLLNYTRVNSKIAYAVSPTSTATIVDDLIGLSPSSWNTTLYYDDGRLSARVSTTARSSFLTRVPGQNNNDVEGKNATLNVDLSISYKINKNLEVTLEGVNLTNEANDQFISRARNSSVVYHVTGREYLVGLRYKF